MTETNEPQGDLLTADPPETTPFYSDEYSEFVKQKGWKVGDDVLKSYKDLEKDYSGRVKIPSQEAAAEEIRAFYTKTGCPENAEGYEIKAPKGAIRDEGIEGAMKQVAFEQGVNKLAFETIVNKYYEKLASDMVQSRVDGEAALKEQHGEKYDEVVTIANRFFDSCSKEFCELVKQSGLANHPVFINEFLAKGKQTMADTLIKGDTGGGSDEDKGWKPKSDNSPEMYRNMEGPEGEKARAWFIQNKGYKY